MSNRELAGKGLVASNHLFDLKSQMIDFEKHFTDDGILAIRVSGELTGDTHQYFFDCVQDEMEAGHKHIVINFADVGYVSSAGLGTLVRARARISTSGGLIYLARIENKLIDIFSIVGFEKVFNIFPTEDEALEAMKQQIATRS